MPRGRRRARFTGSPARVRVRADSSLLRRQESDSLFHKREVASTRPLPSRPGRNQLQPTATVFACLGRFRADRICHRLPAVATTGLHKGSIICNQLRQQTHRGSTPSLFERWSSNLACRPREAVAPTDHRHELVRVYCAASCRTVIDVNSLRILLGCETGVRMTRARRAKPAAHDVVRLRSGWTPQVL
jgi:hypothetical protein